MQFQSIPIHESSVSEGIMKVRGNCCTGNSTWTRRRTPFLSEQPSTRRGSPKKLWTLRCWRYSRTVWMQSWPVPSRTTLLRQGDYTCGVSSARSKFQLLENQWWPQCPQDGGAEWYLYSANRYKQQCMEEKFWAADPIGSKGRKQGVRGTKWKQWEKNLSGGSALPMGHCSISGSLCVGPW